MKRLKAGLTCVGVLGQCNFFECALIHCLYQINFRMGRLHIPNFVPELLGDNKDILGNTLNGFSVEIEGNQC